MTPINRLDLSTQQLLAWRYAQFSANNIAKILHLKYQIKIKAAKTLNLAVAGVDIIRSNKGPLLLEVNSSPGLEGIEKATGIDLANSMIQAIERKLKYTA